MSRARVTMDGMTLRYGLWLCLLLGCAQSTNLVPRARQGSGDAGQALDAEQPAADAEPVDAGELRDAADGDVALGQGGVVFCGSAPCACSNRIDDDGDGLTDGFDPECTGPYDNDERSFATGEIKEGNPKCEDCFFDGNAGSGDDGCDIAASCVTSAMATGAPPKCNRCTTSGMCSSTCLPRTPNGCDCFGCCEFTHQGATLFIRLADTCTVDVLTNEQRCPRCMQSPYCVNRCERCELCPGKTAKDLPADCASGSGPSYSCSNGKVCTESGVGCGVDEYCLQGCCIPILL